MNYDREIFTGRCIMGKYVRGENANADSLGDIDREQYEFLKEVLK